MKNFIVALAISLSACSHFNAMPPSVVDDSAIRDEVLANLLADGFTSIDLKVDQGIVTLSGRLSSRTYREKAVSDAEKVSGVRRVVNHIEVQ
jgi:osmotically-inducible protein OsmY